MNKCRGVACNALRKNNTATTGVIYNATTNGSISPQQNSLSVIMRSCKSAVTRLCRQQNISFQWQRNFGLEVKNMDQGKEIFYSIDTLANYIYENKK